MAGRHGEPSTGTGKAGGHGAKPATGTTLWKATAALFGVGKKKIGKKKK